MSPPGPVPPDVEELLRDSGFRDAGEAAKSLEELFRDTAEMLAFARVSGILKDLLIGCPDPDAALRHLARLVAVRGSRIHLYRTFQDHPALLDRFVHVTASSRYLADILVRNPDLLEYLSDSARLAAPRSPGELKKDLKRHCDVFPSQEAKLEAMRRFQRREVLRIAAADLLGFQDVVHLTRQFSDVADAFVSQALSILGGGARLIVLAMGKWGGRELNYSSDVDVIFLTPQSGNLARATRQAQRLIRALSAATPEGVVYRVDTRLRPYGSEGTLVSTTRMFEGYLKTKAHPAERQAMLKARAVGGDVAAGRRFLGRISATILKGGATARRDVRKLKARIEKGLSEAEGHVKLAPGGIRDVEFLVQALQLEAGRSRPEVITANTLEGIGKLDRAGLLSPDDAQVLREAYVFLRCVEHRMQLAGNRQVYRLPAKEEDLKRLGGTMGFRGRDADARLLDAYDVRARRVRAIFDRVLGPESAAAPADPKKVAVLRKELGRAGERLDASLIGRCAEVLEAVHQPGEVRLHAQRNDGGRWTVIICAGGDVGLPSFVSGLMAAGHANVLSGDFLMVRRRESGKTRRRAKGLSRRSLGVLEVRLPDEASKGHWDAFRGRLEELTRAASQGRAEEARKKLIDQVGETLRSATGTDDPLLPMRIEVRNDAAAKETALHLHAADTFGFVFGFIEALRVLELRVARAVIRTLGDVVYDTFWVTDREGRKVVEAGAVERLRSVALLVKQFTHLLPRSPHPGQALRQFTALLGRMFAQRGRAAGAESLGSEAVLTTLAELLGVSRFLWEDFLLIQHESLFPVVADVKRLDRRVGKKELARELNRVLRGAAEPFARLNEFKDREMFRIDLRHITGRSGFAEFTSGLSDLGEVIISKAAEMTVREQERRSGVPKLRNGRKCPWTICALGKFGGRELGIASDLDLVFIYGGEGRADNGSFFVDVVKSLLRNLKGSRDGTFGIDLRLRPHGSGGALASSLDGFRSYYSTKGAAKQWERMALVKLRPVAGSSELGARVVKARDAYVYSGKPLDRENILHLRARQAAERVDAGEVSAKLSPGGLVDVEYFVQSRQIVAGARDRGVRVENTREAIDGLVRGGHVGKAPGAGLADCLIFLRRLIDAQRVVRGYAKDSKIPPDDAPEFAYLVRRLGYSSPVLLRAEIRQRMTFARNLWRRE